MSRMNRGRVNAKRRTPRRRSAPQEDAAWWESASTQLVIRCGGRCERCGRNLDGRMERHHRQRRQVGGDRLDNLLALHPSCHTYITEHPEEARANGWIVSSYAENPGAVPVRISDMWWTLIDDGRKIPVP